MISDYHIITPIKCLCLKYLPFESTWVHIRFFGGVRVAHLFGFLNCSIMCFNVLSSVLWCPLRFRIWTMFGSFLPPVVCRRARVLFASFMFAYAQQCSTHIVLWFWFVFLGLVFPMLSVSLDCLFLIAPSVFFNIYWYHLYEMVGLLNSLPWAHRITKRWSLGP